MDSKNKNSEPHYKIMCGDLEEVQETSCSTVIDSCIKVHLCKIFPNEAVAMILYDKVNLEIVKIIDIDFPKEKLNKIIIDGTFGKKISDFALYKNGLNYANYSFISYGTGDSDRRYLSLFCISNTKNVDILANISALKVIAPHLHAAIVNTYHDDLIKSSPECLLTTRELEILKWVSKGKTNYEIGIILSISAFTVKNHVANILLKLQVSSRTQALEKAMSLGYFWT